MRRRAKINERKGVPPQGPSKYAKKRQRGLLLAREAQRHPSPTPETAQPESTRTLPAGTELASGKVSGNFLKEKGYVFLMDKEKRRIFLTDFTLQKFDKNFRLENGFIIECAVAVEQKGRRAVEVFDIQPPK